LIDPDSVLTAAHCVVGPQTEVLDVRVWIAAKSAVQSSQTGWWARTVTDGWVHDKYKPPMSGGSTSYDVAVLKLNQAVPNAKPIKLNTSDQAGDALETPGRVLTATGWGRTDPNNPNSAADRMREVQLSVIPDTTAQQV
jgi:V8-like Glu-specific endopeptidase